MDIVLNYKDGRCLKSYYCKNIECKKEISMHSALSGSGLCKKCSYIARKYNKKWRNNISNTLKQYYKTHDCWNKGLTKHDHPALMESSIRMKEDNPIRKINQKGSNNFFWKGGKSFEPYPITFTIQFKEKNRIRNGNRCFLCGIHQHDLLYKLSIHHVDYDKENLDGNNLVALCKKCHGKTNENREQWEVYFKQKINEILEFQMV